MADRRLAGPLDNDMKFLLNPLLHEVFQKKMCWKLMLPHDQNAQ